MVPNSFLVILFSIIIIFPFTISEDNTLDDYYNGDKNDESSNGGDLEDNDCLCDINPLQCDFHCCCDENCPNDAIEDWENHSKCINEQNTPRLSDDKCVDINLFPTWYYNSSKEYPRRGIHLEKQTEDIPKKSAVITNLCFSIDNSKSNDIKTLDDLEKYGYKNIENLYNDIFDLYIEPYFIKSNKDASQTGTANDGIKGININNENVDHKDYFVKNGKFSLLSGTNCENRDIVEKWSPKNYSCLMNQDNSINYNYFSNVKINGFQCKVDNDGRYYIDNGLLKKNENTNNLIVRQVEFILNIDDKSSDINNCIINLVEFEIPNSITTFTFKNTVVFTKDNNIPYRYSGNIGYLNGYPLKIYIESENKVYNDFYIVGRDSNGDCRTGDDILNYLFSSDKPLLFNEDYTYSCKLDENGYVESTILYKKLDAIKKIAKYGSSDYNNIKDNDDWIDITNNLKNLVVDKNVLINMNIYYGTYKKKGFYSHKYIYRTTLDIKKETDCDNNNKCNIKLEIKFYSDDESNDTRYKKIPDRPFFIPNIPDDLLDPFINPDVDK